MAEKTRELSFKERATYGKCPACGAEDGEKCDPLVGIPLGRTADGGFPENGAHLGRLQQAPQKVKEVPIR